MGRDDGRVRGSAATEGGWEAEVDSGLPRQYFPEGLFALWWTGEDGARQGLLGRIQLCPWPNCPLREAELHFAPVPPTLARLRGDAERGVRAQGPDGPIELDGNPRGGAVALTFESDGRRFVRSVGDRTLVRRIREALDDELWSFIERFWDEQKGPHRGLPRASEPGRNAPCPCGSGKKYKKCCLERGVRIQRLPGGMVALTMRRPGAGAESPWTN
jgi:hypothetical protein